MHTHTMNTDESLKLFVRAIFPDREYYEFVRKYAIESVDTGLPLPEELADLFVLEIHTRPSGTKYGVLDFA